MENLDHFPGYPRLKRQAMTDRGLATLHEVNRTSDGFLVGLATFEDEEGNVIDTHSVFLGEA
jgi:hypothetical protein